MPGGREIDDRQPPMTERNAMVRLQPNAMRVRAPALYELQLLFDNSRSIDEGLRTNRGKTCNSTHTILNPRL